MSNKWVRSISFNRTNTDDIARLKLIGNKSFSRFVKSLLDAEIKRKEVLAPDTSKADTPQPQQGVIPPTTKPSIYDIHQQKRSERSYQTKPVLNPMLKRD
ncbi:hypothetical protein [Bacillus solitudinis]|uniref:hypothetical protein n=1 Tax=Bacillus solitudinis TaxID=2014074 RepID=UPI000C24EB82|nr:hypothetical protein [Bacillus solitudinis]